MLILALVILAIVFGWKRWTGKKVITFLTPTKMLELVKAEPLQTLAYQGDLKLRGELPLIFVGNSHIRIALWEVRQNPQVADVILKFLHPRTAVGISITFRNGKLNEWTQNGERQLMAEPSPTQFREILALMLKARK
jgi:hypothetical protein